MRARLGWGWVADKGHERGAGPMRLAGWLAGSARSPALVASELAGREGGAGAQVQRDVHAAPERQVAAHAAAAGRHGAHGQHLRPGGRGWSKGVCGQPHAWHARLRAAARCCCAGSPRRSGLKALRRENMHAGGAKPPRPCRSLVIHHTRSAAKAPPACPLPRPLCGARSPGPPPRGSWCSRAPPCRPAWRRTSRPTAR